MTRVNPIAASVFVVFAGVCAFAQQGAAPAAPAAPRAPAPARGRAPLFFHEEWKQTPAGGEHPVTPESIGNPNLELKLYG